MNKQMDHTSVEQRAMAHVLSAFEEQEDPRLVFHNYQLCMSAVDIIQAMQQNKLRADAAIATIAACFWGIGCAHDVKHPLKHAMREARTFFARENYPEAERIEVVQCLQAMAQPKSPASEAEKILSDAWLSAAYLDQPEERFALLRLEWDLLNQRHPDKVEWLNLQQDQLLNIRLHTAFAKRVYEPERTRYLMQIREKLHKQQRKEEKEESPSGRFSNLETTDPVRATQTFFRANYRNHINLSAIADNKANIMISVNTILLSVLIAFLSYQNIGQTKPIILLPVVIFLVTGLASLIFAVLSAKPKVTMLNKQNQPSPEEVKRNIVFFGNFVSLDLPEYEEAMDELFRDSSLLYGNMVRDLYHLGKVLEKKYRYLTVSYNIFMVGFIATVASFLVVLFS